MWTLNGMLRELKPGQRRLWAERPDHRLWRPRASTPLCARQCLGEEEAMMGQQQGQGAEAAGVRRKGSLNQLGKFSIVLFIRQPCWCFLGKGHQWISEWSSVIASQGWGWWDSRLQKEGLNPAHSYVPSLVSWTSGGWFQKGSLDPNHAESRHWNQTTSVLPFLFYVLVSSVTWDDSYTYSTDYGR